MGRLVLAAAPVAGRLDQVCSFGPAYLVQHRILAARRIGLRPRPETTVNRAIWENAAQELGADIVDCEGEILEIQGAECGTRVWRHVTMLDDWVTIKAALNRPLVHRLLTASDVPVPEHLEFAATDPRPALTLMARRPSTYVLKPASGTGGGQGITCRVRRPSDLVRAMLAAARFADRLVLERQLAGAMYRLLFLDNELLDVVRRDPPSVIGDGKSRIADLIFAENRHRLLARGEGGLQLMRPDLDCLLTLRDADVGPRSVPAAGRRICVKTATSENARRNNVTVRPWPSAALIAEARRAVRAIGLRLAGVDVVTLDASRGLREAGGAVIEVNGTPGLHYHYLVDRRERATRVAVPILRRLLEGSSGGSSFPPPRGGVGLRSASTITRSAGRDAT